MEREVGGGIGMGNTCKPMAVSFQCMTKSTTNKKKYIYIYKKISSTLKALPLPLAPHISENEENIRATFQLRTRDQIRNKGQT